VKKLLVTYPEIDLSTKLETRERQRQPNGMCVNVSWLFQVSRESTVKRT